MSNNNFYLDNLLKQPWFDILLVILAFMVPLLIFATIERLATAFFILFLIAFIVITIVLLLSLFIPYASPDLKAILCILSIFLFSISMQREWKPKTAQIEPVPTETTQPPKKTLSLQSRPNLSPINPSLFPQMENF